jgi:hydroxypyruvate reductase
VRAALAAIDGKTLARQALAGSDLQALMQSAGAVDVIAAGKGAGPMLSAVMAAPPARLRQVVGVCTTPPPPGVPPGVRWHLSAHPVPDERSVAAAKDALAVAEAAGARDVLILLLSGGASAMMALPAAGVTLADKRLASKQLLSLGAEIHGLNAVRKHLSAIKGGWLAASNRGTTVTLALSDVVGDDLSAIGSGPTVADETTFADSLAILDAHGGRDRYPRTVVERLTRGAAGAVPETPKPGDPRLARGLARVIGGGRTAVAGARLAAESLGYRVWVIDEPITGEARIAARTIVDAAAQFASREGGPICVLSCGETTVRTAGSGKGGRNQECALAMAPVIHSVGQHVVAASVGTDGIDGPTDAAGAVVDSTTIARAEAAGIGGPGRYLEEHNSYLYFDALNDLIRTGPTGTNVGDVQVLLIGR